MNGKDSELSLTPETLKIAGLQQLTFGNSHTLDGVTLPQRLQKLTLGVCFNQPLDQVTLPSTLRSLTFGYMFNQCLDGVTWPRSLQELTLGGSFDERVDGVTWPEAFCKVCLSPMDPTASTKRSTA